MKSNFLILVILSLFLSSCGQSESTKKLSSDDNLESTLKAEVISGQETIEFGKLMDFDWESMIILTPYSVPKRIEEEYEIDLTSIEHFRIQERDDINLIVFLRKNEPVSVIEYPRHPGDFSENEIKIINKSDANYDVILTDKKSVGGEQWIRLKKK